MQEFLYLKMNSLISGADNNMNYECLESVLYLSLGASRPLTDSLRAVGEPRTHWRTAPPPPTRHTTRAQFGFNHHYDTSPAVLSAPLPLGRGQGWYEFFPFHSSGGPTGQWGKTTAGQLRRVEPGPPSIRNRKQRKSLKSRNSGEEIAGR